MLERLLLFSRTPARVSRLSRRAVASSRWLQASRSRTARCSAVRAATSCVVAATWPCASSGSRCASPACAIFACSTSPAIRSSWLADVVEELELVEQVGEARGLEHDAERGRSARTCRSRRGACSGGSRPPCAGAGGRRACGSGACRARSGGRACAGAARARPRAGRAGRRRVDVVLERLDLVGDDLDLGGEHALRARGRRRSSPGARRSGRRARASRRAVGAERRRADEQQGRPCSEAEDEAKTHPRAVSSGDRPSLPGGRRPSLAGFCRKPAAGRAPARSRARAESPSSGGGYGSGISGRLGRRHPRPAGGYGSGNLGRHGLERLHETHAYPRPRRLHTRRARLRLERPQRLGGLAAQRPDERAVVLVGDLARCDGRARAP